MMTLEQVRSEWAKARDNWLFYTVTGYKDKEAEERAKREYHRINEIRLDIDREYNRRYYGMDD